MHALPAVPQEEDALYTLLQLPLATPAADATPSKLPLLLLHLGTCAPAALTEAEATPAARQPLPHAAGVARHVAAVQQHAPPAAPGWQQRTIAGGAPAVLPHRADDVAFAAEAGPCASLVRSLLRTQPPAACAPLLLSPRSAPLALPHSSMPSDRTSVPRRARRGPSGSSSFRGVSLYSRCVDKGLQVNV
jgi:hypothetical protein